MGTYHDELQEPLKFVHGKCMFCGQEAKERFYSGSSNIYQYCDCAPRTAYIRLMDSAEKELKSMSEIPKARAALTLLKEKQKDINKQVDKAVMSFSKLKGQG